MKSSRLNFESLLARYGVVAFLVALIIAFSVLSPDKFATSTNALAMINSQAIVLLLALTATLALRIGDFDLSIASVMIVTGATAAVLTRGGQSIVLVFLAAVAIGLVVGLVNGFLIVKIGVSSFVATLGMLTVLSGVAIFITNSSQIFNIKGALLDIARYPVLGLPLRTWYGWILALVLWYLYERTPVGRQLLFVGGGRSAARLAGIKVDRVRLGTFVASSCLAALTGVVFAGYLGGIDPNIGSSFLLQPFAAAFLGATTIQLGRFNVVGTVIGLYLLVVGITGLTILGAERWVNDVFNGLALVLAVTFARLGSRKVSDS